MVGTRETGVEGIARQRTLLDISGRCFTSGPMSCKIRLSSHVCATDGQGTCFMGTMQVSRCSETTCCARCQFAQPGYSSICPSASVGGLFVSRPEPAPGAVVGTMSVVSPQNRRLVCNTEPAPCRRARASRLTGLLAEFANREVTD